MSAMIIGMIVIGCGLIFLANQGVAMQATGGSEKKKNQKAAFAIYQKHCLACHDSVADPEKPGRTRDDWHLVVHVMHNYGMEMTADDADMVIDLLYELRHGMEREAG
jgi:mono/diheme cytochrome c family protein